MKLSSLSLIGILCLISLSVIVPVSASTPLTITTWNLCVLNDIPGYAYHDEGGHILEKILQPVTVEAVEGIRNLLIIMDIIGENALV